MKTIGVGVVVFALVVFVAMTIGSPSAVGQFEQSYVPHRTMWVAKRANVRAGPSIDDLKVGLLEVGERVSVAARIGDWFKLSQRAGQPRRFVYALLLTASKPAELRTAVSTATVSDVGVKTINYGNGDRYHGPVRNGKLHGHGVFTWSDGHRYEGDFVDGQRTGQGIYTWPDGHRYEGNFVDGQRTGQGVYTWPNGNRYEGDFVYGERTGRGVLMWPDGHRYDGDFVDGQRTGQGVYTWPDGERYEGEFVDGRRHGRGVITYADGTRREGEWRNNELLSSATPVDSSKARQQVHVLCWGENWSEEQAVEFFRERTVADVTRCLEEGANPNSRMADTSLLGAVVHYVAWNDKDRGTAMIVALVDAGARPDPETLKFVENMAWGDRQAGIEGRWSRVVAALRGESTASATARAAIASDDMQRGENIDDKGALWGAIVISSHWHSYPGDVYIGIAWNYPSRSAAIEAAVDRCTSRNRWGGCGQNGAYSAEESYVTHVAFSSAAQRHDSSLDGDNRGTSFLAPGFHGKQRGKSVVVHHRCALVWSELETAEYEPNTPIAIFAATEPKARAVFSTYWSKSAAVSPNWRNELEMYCNNH